MAVCSECRKETSWFGRVKLGDLEFCGRGCREAWNRKAGEKAAKRSAQKAAATRRKRDERRLAAAEKAEKSPARQKLYKARSRVSSDPHDPYAYLELIHSLDVRLAALDAGEPTIPHADVVKYFEEKYGVKVGD